MDEEVRAAAGGDRAAFGRLIDRTQVRVRSIVLAIVGELARSEEVAQDVYLAAWRGLPQLRAPEKFEAWLHGIARNRAKSAVRDAREKPDSHVAEIADQRPGALDALVAREDARRVEQALEALNEDSRETVVLYYRVGCSVEEAAARLGVSPEVVRKRLSRARERIRAEVLDGAGRALAAVPVGLVTSALERLPGQLPPAAPASVVSSALFALAAGAAATVILAFTLRVRSPHPPPGPAPSPMATRGVLSALGAPVTASPPVPAMREERRLPPWTSRPAAPAAALPVESSASSAPEPEVEAKTNLSGLFVAQRAHFAAHGNFSEDLIALDWLPGAESPTYVFGFCGGGPRSHTMRPEVLAVEPAEPYSMLRTLPLADPCAALVAAGLDPETFRANAESFQAFAVGNVDEDPDLDIWSMSNEKVLRHVRADR